MAKMGTKKKSVARKKGLSKAVKKNKNIKKKSIKSTKKPLKQALKPAKGINKEKSARDAVRIAQKNTLDIIKAAAARLKSSTEKSKEPTADYMNVLKPRRRGRPSKGSRGSAKNSHIYEPEFNGIMEDHLLKDDNNGPVDPFTMENETIDFWTDDDIPMAKGWKDDILDF